MKKCNACNQTFYSDGNFCPHCGAYPVEEINDTENTTNIVCSNCNTIIEEGNVSFCPNCGTNLCIQKANVQASVKEVVNKVKENEFVKSVKQDVGNSQSINLIKDKVKSTAYKVKTTDTNKRKKIKVIAIVAAVVIVVLIIITHIHQCNECDKVYFGNKHTISYWGETENLCKECYDDFYSFW